MGRDLRKRTRGFHIEFGDLGILYALILLLLVVFFTNESFRGASSLMIYRNILKDASIKAVIGVGMTFAIISGDFDLSVGSQLALSSVIFTWLCMTLGVPIWLSMLMILALGICMGAFNGILIAKLRIPAFIATLGMQMAYRAIAQMVTGKAVTVKSDAFLAIATGKFLELPYLFWIMLVLAIVGTVILRKTMIGRHTLAIGNSKDGARISGISIGRTQIMIYLMVGLFTAFAAIMGTARMGASNYNNFSGYEFSVISAVVLGGTALSGGKGSIFNTVMAAIFLATLNTALPTYGVNKYYQKIIEGGVLVFAFSITELRVLIEKMLIKRRAGRELAQNLAK